MARQQRTSDHHKFPRADSALCSPACEIIVQLGFNNRECFYQILWSENRMTSIGAMKNSKFVDGEKLLGDISKAYQGGLFGDVTLILTDNVSVSTNSFMLSCRVPYLIIIITLHLVELS